MLQIPLDGPIIIAEIATDGNEWAVWFFQEMLLIPLDGPIIAAEPCYQWL
jgi:hypothetical protein